MWIGRHFADNTHVPTGHPKTLISREALPIRLPTWLCGHSASRDCHTGARGCRRSGMGQEGPIPSAKRAETVAVQACA